MKNALLISIVMLSSSAFAKTKLQCPIDTIGGERKKVAHFFPLNKTDKIVICAPPDAFDGDKLKSRFLTEYAAFFFRKDESVNRVFGGSGSTAVRFEQRKKKVYEIVHLSLKDSFLPLFRNWISCEDLECKRKDKTCVYDQKKAPEPTAKELEGEYLIFSKATGQKQEITQPELAQMSVLAFSGRKMAIEFFTQLSPQPIVIGPAKTFYEQMQGLLNQMILEGCLKPQEKAAQ